MVHLTEVFRVIFLVVNIDLCLCLEKYLSKIWNDVTKMITSSSDDNKHFPKKLTTVSNKLR